MSAIVCTCCAPSLTRLSGGALIRCGCGGPSPPTPTIASAAHGTASTPPAQPDLVTLSHGRPQPARLK